MQEVEVSAASSTDEPFDFYEWSQEVESIRASMRTARDSSSMAIDVVGILRDIRDGEDE